MIHADRTTLVLSFFFSFAVAVFFSSNLLGQAAPVSRDEARALLVPVVEEYQEVFNTRDVSALSAFYAEDADMIFGNTPKVQGRDAIAAWWRGYFDRQEPERRARFGVETARFIRDGVAVINVSSWTGGRDDQGEELHVRRARGTWILLRSGARWLISALRGLPSEQDQVILTPFREAAVVEETAASETGIQAFVTAYEEAYNSRNPSALSTLYEEDADIIVRNEPAVEGRESIEDWWVSYFATRPFFANPGFKVRFAIEEARMIAPKVALLNIIAGPATNVDEEAPARQARGTWLLVDREAGWLMSALRVLPSEHDRIVRAGENVAWRPGAPNTEEDTMREHTGARSKHDAQREAELDEAEAKEAHKAIARRWFEEVINDRNLDAVLDIYSADYVYHGPEQMELRGPEEVRRFAASILNASSDRRAVVEQQIVEGNLVVTRFTSRGHHTGTFRGIEATGNVLTTEGIVISRIEDGKIVEDWEVIHTAGIP